jgi:hypothetical protein
VHKNDRSYHGDIEKCLTQMKTGSRELLVLNGERVEEYAA